VSFVPFAVQDRMMNDNSTAVEVVPALRRWVRQRLASWFARHARDLPWRKSRDPFGIWVSEIMLQQTQVATVVPYFKRFLEAFPTVRRLAAADEQQVLRLWEGLGYYRRARDLHAAARRLVAEHGGAVPDDPAVFRRLPGVGRYTVGAVLSQAYDRRLPIIEANSQRVLCRLLGIRDDPRSPAVQHRLWQAARELLPRQGSGNFNQALMELGALVCTVAAPDCTACPLARHCAARRLDLQDQIPLRASAPEIVEVSEVAVVVRRGPRVLIAQRPSRGRWPGMWEVPHGTLADGETHEQAACRLLRELTGLEARLGAELLTIRHGVTRFRITMVCLEADYQAGTFASAFYRRARWITPRQFSDLPVSVPQRRLARALTCARQQHLF
jgi:A/G-specific adenine glycosylase